MIHCANGGFPVQLRAIYLNIGALFFAGALSAATITFGGLTGANASPFPSPYMESGFIVTATQGAWLTGQSFGKPFPSIFNGSNFIPLTSSSIQVTRAGGGLFTFSSVDMASNNGVSTYSFSGVGLNQSGSLPNSRNLNTYLFGTYVNNTPDLLLTSLTINIDPIGSPTSFNIDNIVITSAVPEPAPTALIGAAVGLLMLVGRRVKPA